MEFVAPLAAIATIVQTIVFLVVTYRAERRAMNDGAVRVNHPSRRLILFMGILALFSWGAVGFDYYDRHHRPIGNDDQLVLSWGGLGADSFQITINGGLLIDYSKDYKVALIVRIVYADIDQMTDTAIGKGELYTITNNTQVLARIGLSGMKIIPYKTLAVEYDLVLIPNGLSMDQIRTLSDVSQIGGKIIATRGNEAQFAIGPPAASPPSPTLPMSPPGR